MPGISGGLAVTWVQSVSLVLFAITYCTYTNTSHAAPRPAREQGLPPPPSARICLSRRSSSHPLLYLGARRQPQLRPGPRARARTCA